MLNSFQYAPFPDVRKARTFGGLQGPDFRGKPSAHPIRGGWRLGFRSAIDPWSIRSKGVQASFRGRHNDRFRNRVCLSKILFSALAAGILPLIFQKGAFFCADSSAPSVVRRYGGVMLIFEQQARTV